MRTRQCPHDHHHRSPLVSIVLRVVAGALLLSTSALAAQAPKPELLAAFSGEWHLDSARSDPMPQNAAARQRSDPAAAVGGAPSGGGRRGRSGGGAGGAPAGGPPAGGGFGGGRGGGGRQLRELMTELAPPPVLLITATADSAVLANTEGGEIGWAVDGRVHQHVQIDGTSTEEMARWKGDRLELHLGVTGSLDLKRELRVVEDGAVLEMKLELSGPGVPRKMARKVVFVRGAS
ncbi:MAG: hypothetical protein KC544_11360 [Gemmatimonadetes bacterium]|nr:hypothetical protein [Gemmatimonadota bacterium]